MIVDPWGTVVAQASDRVGFIAASVDQGYIESVRQNMPIINHHIL